METKFHFANNEVEFSFSLHIQISSDNKLLYDLMKVRYPDTYRCTLKIEEYFETKMNWKCDKEELLYLMIHINRLCS